MNVITNIFGNITEIEIIEPLVSVEVAHYAQALSMVAVLYLRVPKQKNIFSENS